MPFSLSPTVNWREIDLTTAISAVTTAEGALAGVYRWGPIGQRFSISDEATYKKTFGGPTNFNFETWFTGANFLAYGGAMLVSRAAVTSGNTVTKTFTGNSTNLFVQNGNTTVQVGNTTNLAEGMRVFYCNNTAVPTSNVSITSVVNGSHIILSSAASANVTSANIVFRSDIVYTAVAQETADYDINWAGQIIENEHDYTAKDGTFDSTIIYAARYAGEKGNSIRIAEVDTASNFYSNTDLSPNAQINSTATGIAAIVGSNTLTVTITPTDTANTTQVTTANSIAGSAHASLTIGDLIQVGNNTVGFQYPKITNIGDVADSSGIYSFTLTLDNNVRLLANTTASNLVRYWEFYNLVDKAPGTSDYVLRHGNTAAVDEKHIVVVDELGEFTGEPGAVLEVYKGVSRATDAKAVDGGTNYYKDVINQGSNYIWVTNDRTTATSATASLIESATSSNPINTQMYGGSDGLDENDIPIAALATAYDLFASAEEVDVSLIMAGKARGESVTQYTQLANYIIDNICEIRKDCIVLISPDRASVVNNNQGDQADSIVAFRNYLRATSYGVLDTGYKYQYDRYNDIRRWVPLNGDIAGLCARTDMTNDPWWSIAGFNRGQIKNIERLAYNPVKKADRDILFKNDANPVVSFQGKGTILFGDKTLLGKNSAFNAINVRRLFIVLEKSISNASALTLFEFNDDFTRAQFKSMVIPYLKNVKGKRGIYDFLVVCDNTNNTAEVIDNFLFVGDIYIKPARAIREVQLNFVATKTGVSFSEVVGRFG